MFAGCSKDQVEQPVSASVRFFQSVRLSVCFDLPWDGGVTPPKGRELMRKWDTRAMDTQASLNIKGLKGLGLRSPLPSLTIANIHKLECLYSMFIYYIYTYITCPCVCVLVLLFKCAQIFLVLAFRHVFFLKCWVLDHLAGDERLQSLLQHASRCFSFICIVLFLIMFVHVTTLFCVFIVYRVLGPLYPKSLVLLIDSALTFERLRRECCLGFEDTP